MSEEARKNAEKGQVQSIATRFEIRGACLLWKDARSALVMTAAVGARTVKSEASVSEWARRSIYHVRNIPVRLTLLAIFHATFNHAKSFHETQNFRELYILPIGVKNFVMGAPAVQALDRLCS